MQSATRKVNPLNSAAAHRLPALPLLQARLGRGMALLDTQVGFMVAYGATLLLTLLGRVVNLGASDLWLDETISYFIANRVPFDIIRYTASNVAEHPPGYYFLLHFWMSLTGTGEFALRLFTVVGALLHTALLMVLARRWFGKRVALLAGLLLSVQPLAHFLGRDARMYSWFMAAVVLMVYLLDVAIEKRRPRDWARFGLSALVALAFNYLATFVLLGLALFFLIQFRRLRQSALAFALTLGALFALPLLWILLQPGPRGSALGLLAAMTEPWSPARLLPVFLGWPLGLAADNGATPPVVALATLSWLLAALGVVFMPVPRGWPRRALQWLLACLIIAPPLLGSFVFAISKARYYSGVIGFFTLAVALGIVACWRRSKPLGAALLAALLILNGRDALASLQSHWRPFSVPMNHILDRARPGEPVVYTFPWDQFLDGYYNTAGLPAVLLPPGLEPIEEPQAVAAAGEVFASTDSAWLMLYPTELKPEIIEAGMNQVAYGGEKTWFEGSRGVVRYFAARPMTEQSGDGRLWDARIALNRWWRSDPAVAAGDALRLEFEWQDLAPRPKAEGDDEGAASELIELSLIGADGQVWAQRVGGPCNGLCPLEAWGEQAFRERAALYVPADTPPGRYSVRLRWLGPDGAPLLVRSESEPSPQDFTMLFDAEVLPPADANAREAALAERSSARTADGSLELVSYDPPERSVLPGSNVTVATQWRVAQPLPPLDARLALRQGGEEAGVYTVPLGPEWHRSEAWMPGRLMRSQPTFTLPGTLEPGEYDATLEVGPPGGRETALKVGLGQLTVRDRERNFEMPSAGEAVGVEWQEGITLARLDAPTSGVAGQTLPVTLVWQADRPTAGNWKVFVHLVGGRGAIRGYGDAYPLGGAALTPTWQHGEVLVDEHPIQLPLDIPPGEYRLRIGFYNEATNERLPLSPGVDTYEWPSIITVTRPE